MYLVSLETLGYFSDTKATIVVIAACYLPDRSLKNYDFLMEQLFLWVYTSAKHVYLESDLCPILTTFSHLPFAIFNPHIHFIYRLLTSQFIFTIYLFSFTLQQVVCQMVVYAYCGWSLIKNFFLIISWKLLAITNPWPVARFWSHFPNIWALHTAFHHLPSIHALPLLPSSDLIPLLQPTV